MDFFQTIKRCCRVHVQATSLLKRNKHWNAFRVWLYEKQLGSLRVMSHWPRCCWYVKSILFSFCVYTIKGDDALTEMSPFEVRFLLFPYKHPATISRLKLSLCKLHIFSIVIIIWNRFGFRRELQLEVEQMYTTYYWIIVTWLRDRGVTWHVGWVILILVTTLLSLWALPLVKIKIKYFWFITWPLDRSVTWLCGWGPFILNHDPGKFGIHWPWESGDITSLICHVTTWSICHVFCR